MACFHLYINCIAGRHPNRSTNILTHRFQQMALLTACKTLTANPKRQQLPEKKKRPLPTSICTVTVPTVTAKSRTSAVATPQRIFRRTAIPDAPRDTADEEETDESDNERYDLSVREGGALLRRSGVHCRSWSREV